jgi:RimJ/RimL family protein N-acetyltransferase
LLEGKSINLRIVEREDLPLLADWANDPAFLGDFVWLPQQSKAEWEKKYDNLPSDTKWFFIEKKDGTKIGTMFHFPRGSAMEIGYVLIPGERGKGYGTEAVKIIVDYLFLSKEIVRVQAVTDPDNLVSQKVLQKSGFRKEGTIRKSTFIRGEWRDGCMYSILREEWKKPGALNITSK